MNPTTKRLRAAIADIPDSWTRLYVDGRSAWAGIKMGGRGREGMLEIKAALERAGFHCACNGKPGTAGEFIVDVLLGDKP